jgi:hypothetical protein
VTDAAAEGCELALVSDTRAITRLDRLVRDAAAQQRAEPDITAELAGWVRPPDGHARDGVPATARLAAGTSVRQGGSTDEIGPGRLVAQPRSLDGLAR